MFLDALLLAPKFSEKAGCFSNSYWRWFAMARGLNQRSV